MARDCAYPPSGQTIQSAVIRYCDCAPARAPRRNHCATWPFCFKGACRCVVKDRMERLENDFLGVAHDYFETTDGDHGRVEIRRHWTIGEFGDFPGKAAWKDLNTIAMVESECHVKGEVTTDRRYYINSLTSDAKQFAACVRAHWGIENKLH